MAEVDLSRQLWTLDTKVQNGAEAREPIAQMLEIINNSGGNVISITDGTDLYTYEDFMTPDEVRTYFNEGSGLIDKMPEKASERKRGMTSKSIYRQMVIMSNILNKIIGQNTTEEEPINGNE